MKTDNQEAAMIGLRQVRNIQVEPEVRQDVQIGKKTVVNTPIKPANK